MVKPCCCSLQLGTQIISLLQIITSIMMMIFTVVELGFVKQHMGQQGKSIPGEVITMFVVEIMMYILSIILGIILLQGSNKRDLRMCKIWLYVTLVLTIISMVSILFLVFSSRDVGTIVQGVVPILFSIYYMWVVHAFMEEIKSGGNLSSTV